MTEQIVNFERMEYALTLFGNSDENIRMLEQGYGVSVVFRGTDIKVSGDAEKVMTCTRCIEGLLKMVESGEELSAQNIRYMMSLVEEGREQEAETLGKDVICITDRAGRYRQDLSRRGHGGKGLPSAGGQPHRADTARRGGRGKAGLFARRPAEQGGPLPAAAL